MRHTSHWNRTEYLYTCVHDSATCVVGYMCGYDLLTTEVSFMRGYTGDDSGMDRYRYRTSIAILNQQLDIDWRRSHTGHMMITCLCGPHGNIWECMGVFLGLRISSTSVYQMFRSLTYLEMSNTFHNLKNKKTQQTLMSSVVGLGRD